MKLTTHHLKGLDHEIDFAPLTVVVGPNGAGKSTLATGLRVIALGYEPARGRTEDATATLMRQSPMSVELTLDDGRVCSRTLTRRDKRLTWTCKTSWVESHKSTDHASAMQALFGPDQESVEQVLDVRSLLALSPDKRAGRIRQILEATGFSIQEKLDLLNRYLVADLAGVEEVTTGQVGTLAARIPPGIRQELRKNWAMLKALLGGPGGLDNTLTWANGEKRQRLRDIDQKEKAWRERAAQVAELPAAGEERIAYLEAERSRLDRELGALQQQHQEHARLRAAITDNDAEVAAVTQELDRLHGQLSRSPIRERVETLQAELDALGPAVETQEDEEHIQPLEVAEEAARTRIEWLKGELARFETAEPWREVHNLADYIAGKAKGQIRNIAFRIKEIAAGNLPDQTEQQELQSRYQKDLRAAEEKHTAAVQELIAARARQTTRQQGDPALQAEREALLKRIAEAQLQRATHDNLVARLKSAERVHAAALKRKAEFEGLVVAGVGPDAIQELAEEREAVAQELTTLQNARTLREDLAKLEVERDAWREGLKAWQALENALQKLRAAEVSASGGPLIGRMNQFFEAAGIPATAYLTAGAGECNVGWMHPDGAQVDIGAMSAGEWVLYTAAFVAAILGRSTAPVRVLLVEAGECDGDTFRALLRGIQAVQEALTHAVVMTWVRVKNLPEGWNLRVLGGKKG